MVNIPKNMYQDAKFRWNIGVGCLYNCKYCDFSFKRQMKRQKNRCMDCYNYVPHFHEERLYKQLPRTYGDEFIWIWSSGDITFAKKEWVEKTLNRVVEMPERTFLLQSKNPRIFKSYSIPENVILATTIESNKWYKDISTAPHPYIRFMDFYTVKHPRKFITIEPILDFDLWTVVKWVEIIAPERVYIGYDTKKTWWLINGKKFYLSNYEPLFNKTERLIKELEKITTVKRKYIKED